MTSSSESEPMSRYAPVSITVYDRVDHLKQTIDALKANPEAAETVLYVFSDAARPGHEDKIEKVRAYVRSIEGFAEVRAHFQETNSFQRNTHEARTIPLRDFGRMIRMEDDIVASPHYLAFMNAALDKYADDPRVFSICAFTPDFPSPEPEQVFMTRDFTPWGYGIWEDRNLEDCIARSDYYSRLKNEKPKAFREATRLHPLHKQMWRLLEKGRDAPPDLKIMAHHFLADLYSIKPGQSLVLNIGLDGSGMSSNGGKIARFVAKMALTKPDLPDRIEYKPEIDKALYAERFRGRKLSLWRLNMKLWFFATLPAPIFESLRNAKARLTGKQSAAKMRG